MEHLPTAARRTERWIGTALVLAILGFYVWTVQTTTPSLLVPRGDGRWTDYHNLLVDGFLKGHLYLDYAPDPQLIAATDPYNPAKRPSGGLHDAAYFHGHYYLYFGPAPAIVLLLPWRLLTGHELPGATADVLMTGVGFLCSVACWWRLRREFFPRSSLWSVVCVLPVLGLAGMTHAVLRRPSFWELAIASGYGFAMASLLCATAAPHSRRPAAWLAAAGLLLGLAIGSRPTYAVGAPLLLAPLWVLWQEGRWRGEWRLWPGRRWWSVAGSGAAALGAVVGALLAYNRARFGQWLDFGFHYQLTEGYEALLPHFDLRYIPANLHLYYLSLPQWSRYFPFVHPIRHYIAPPPYYGSEGVTGLVPAVPFVLLAIAAPLGLRGRGRGEYVRLAGALLAPALLFVGVGGFALIFFSAVIRYMVDFTPALLLLAGLGWLAVEREVLPGWLAGPARVGALTLAAVSAGFGVMSNFELYDFVRIQHPAMYRRLTGWANAPVRWVEDRLGERRGPLEVRLRLPRDQSGRLEPLVTTGWGERQDYLFIFYSPDGRQIRLGFDHTGHGLEWTPLLAPDFSAAHTLQVEMGSFYPPDQTPAEGRRPLGPNSTPHHRLRVVWDGTVCFDHPQAFYDSSPEALRIGDSATGIYGEYFTGRVLSVRPWSGR